MAALSHTVNMAMAMNIVIQDDAGRPVRTIIFPFLLLFFHIPAGLYACLGRLSPLWGAGGALRDLWRSLSPFWGAGGAYLSAWRADLSLILLAACLLARDRRFAEV